MNRDRQKNMIAWAIIIAALCVNLWHLPKGFSSRDSSNWLGIVFRLSQGDLPIINEWHPAQMSTILLIPLMKLFLHFKGSTEGVVLFFRYAYLIMNLCVGLFIFFKAKKYDNILAAVLCAIVLLFSMGGEMLPNYNTMGLSCCIVFALLFTDPGKQQKLSSFFSGLFYAGLVLCCPYMALFYLIFSVSCLISFFRKNSYSREICGKWLPFTLGSVLLALPVMIYMFSQAPVMEYLHSVSQLFRDPDHPTGRFSWLFQTLKLFKAVWRVTKPTIIIIPFYVLTLILMFCFRNKNINPFIWINILLVITILLIFAYRDSVHNFSMVVFVPLGVLTMLLDKTHEKNLRRMFFIGLMYIFMINLSSNTVLNASSMASIVCLIPSAIMFTQFLNKKELTESSSMLRVTKLLLIGVFTVLLGFEVFDRVTRLFQEESPYLLDTMIERGPLKGTYTTRSKAEKYDTQLSYVEENLDDSDQCIFVFGDNGWPYLAAERKTGSYALWLKEYRQVDIYRLTEYYSLFPDHIPDAMIVLDSSLEYLNDAISVVSQANPDIKLLIYPN